MRSIRSSSTAWRATCIFPTYKSDITRDYVKAQLQEFDVIEYNGAGCKTVESINIRGHGSSSTFAFLFISMNCTSIQTAIKVFAMAAPSMLDKAVL